MTENDSTKIGGILLAAGGSSRLGRPKQLVQYREKTLIRRAAESLLEAGCSPVVVVLGGEVDGSKAELQGLSAEIAVNTEWASGMSSSIVCGLHRMLEIEPRIDAVLIALCDQPNITSRFLAGFIERYERERHDIIATDHGDVLGVPALFSATLFNDLLALKGDKGARQLIRNSDKVVTIQADAVFFDIDTPEDLERFGSV